MATRSPIGARAAALKGRRRECGVLDRLIEAVRGGESRPARPRNGRRVVNVMPSRESAEVACFPVHGLIDN